MYRDSRRAHRLIQAQATIRRRCVKTSGEILTVRTTGGAAAAKVRSVIGVVLATVTNTPAGANRERLALWALRVLVDPCIRLDICGPHPSDM